MDLLLCESKHGEYEKIADAWAKGSSIGEMREMFPNASFDAVVDVPQGAGSEKTPEEVAADWEQFSNWCQS